MFPQGKKPNDSTKFFFPAKADYEKSRAQISVPSHEPIDTDIHKITPETLSKQEETGIEIFDENTIQEEKAEAGDDVPKQIDYFPGAPGKPTDDPYVRRGKKGNSEGTFVYEPVERDWIWTRKHKSSERPPDIPSEVWAKSQAKADELKAGYEARKAKIILEFQGKLVACTKRDSVTQTDKSQKYPNQGRKEKRERATIANLTMQTKPMSFCFDETGMQIPMMPRTKKRPHVPNPPFPLPFSAYVARPVGPKEIEQNKKAQEALNKEWSRLKSMRTWEEDKVKEWADVAEQARLDGTSAHVGSIFEICVEKGSELEITNPLRKYKGRVVFQGNWVKDESWKDAVFGDMSASPANLCATKMADA